MTKEESQKVMQLYNNLLLGFGLTDKQLKDLAELNAVVLSTGSGETNQERML